MNRAGWLAFLLSSCLRSCWSADHVVIVSVDGLRSETIEALGPTGAPNFHRLMNEGVYTHNARTDYNWTQTVPNHVSMVTARPVDGSGGHNYTSNSTPGANANFHANKGSYITSMYDVAHDNNKRTGLFVSKEKLVIIDQSYNDVYGAVDHIGFDNGRDKIDQYVHNDDATSDELVEAFRLSMTITPLDLVMLHLRDPDAVGHGNNWETAAYSNAVQAVDSYLGTVLFLLGGTVPYVNHTTLIVTADHGGAAGSHQDETDLNNYRVPFYVWGIDVPASGDLYSINFYSRLEPGTARPGYEAARQPIRNGDCANLALMLLGLPAIPDAGAIINQQQDLDLSIPTEGGNVTLEQQVSGRGLDLRWTNLGEGWRYRVQMKRLVDDPWVDAPGSWPTARPYWVVPMDAARGYFRVRAP